MSEHKIVVGLGYGDEGKGTITSYLATNGKTDAIVKFSGGPQTAHNVILDDGTHHTFRQFGSATLQGVATILSRFTLVNPLSLALEADVLESKIGYNPMGNVFVSENALLITEIHREANRQRERARGLEAHGSCAHGIGETMLYATQPFEPDSPIVGDILKPERLLDKLSAYYDWVRLEFPNMEFNLEEVCEGLIETYNYNPFPIIDDETISDFITRSDKLIFEGTQGILLDEWHGFHPNTTWSTTTSKNALTLLYEAGYSRDDVEVIGITRTYGTRHGYGPFPTEIQDDEFIIQFPEAHNKDGEWQGSFRIGNLDLTTLKYAVEVDGEIDSIALTHCDYLVTELAKSKVALTPAGEDELDLMEAYNHALKTATDYETIKVKDLDALKSVIESTTGKRIMIESHGPRLGDKRTLTEVLA